MINELLGNPLVVLSFIVVFSMLVIWIIYILLPWMIKRKGLNVAEILDVVEDVINTTDRVAEMLDTDPAEQSVPEIIINLAKVAVANAEQLCNIGEIDEDTRKAEAISYIKDALIEMGIEVTESHERLIEGAVEATVYLLKEFRE